ncbi:tyrosinase-like [Lampris incognitus]|uniref:tyrosinase-like n=1 Tax=Lampris incognitus TaxID=2546036 RepID=UPI0024B619AD|nr:tyrosinase-like [Lampris incognitus]
MLQGLHFQGPLWSWWIFLLCLMLPRVLQAQFPRPCITSEALESRTCCPLWRGSPCGFKSGRGVCAPHPAKDLPRPVDYRVNWPRAFFDSVCTCQGNYDGFDCGQCLPGWKGPLCMQRHHIERKEITDLTDEERETFLSSLDKAKWTLSDRYMILTSSNTTVEGNNAFHNTSVYDLYVWMHYYSAKSYVRSGNNAAHRGPAFGFWHRVFLLFIEREIRELTGDQDFYIPYWDWTRTNSCNICTNQYLGGVAPDGHIDGASRFSKWETICPFQESLSIICMDLNDSGPKYLTRNPGKDPVFSTLPTAGDVRDIMSAETFDTPPFNRQSRNSFRNKLEGFDIPQDSRHLNASMHNLIHRYLNGTMSLVPIAANDPVFMLHHSFIDKLLETWLREHGGATYPDSEQVHPAQRAQAYMAPFFPLRTNSFYWGKPAQSFGYSYKEHSLRHTETGESVRRGAAESAEDNTAGGVQWLWPVLGTLGVVVLCVMVVTAPGQGVNPLYAVWVKKRNEHSDASSPTSLATLETLSENVKPGPAMQGGENSEHPIDNENFSVNSGC